MSYWIYIQAFFNIMMLVALGWLIADRRKLRAAGSWRADLASMVDTLGEVLVEVERVGNAQAARPEADSPAHINEPAPTPEPEAMAPVAPLPEPESAPVSVPEPVAQRAPRAVAEDAASLVDPVLALAEQGLEPEAIARRLGRPVGEVTLVLGLRGSRLAATA